MISAGYIETQAEHQTSGVSRVRLEPGASQDSGVM
ncbi:MAG: hypothetical protein RL531_645, partial [Actinomycetota bacterium]